MSGEVVKQEDDDECRSPPAPAAVVSASAGKHTVILKTPSRDVPLEEALLHCAPLLDPNSSCSSTSVRLGLHPQEISSPAHLTSSASFTPPEQEGAATGACAPREDRFSATEWGGESDQPWYSYLYSPVSLENSPPQNLLDPAVADLHCMQGPPPPLPTGYQAPQYPLEDPCPPQGVMDPSQQIPFTVKMEEARHSELMAAMDMPTHEPEGGVVGGGGGGWMVEAAPGLWPVKVEPWIAPHHSRYVSEDGSYWLAAAGWQVGSSGPGVMEGGVGLGSPGEDPTASPSDEASTSDAKRPDSKKCGVCGDRALGYNFNAITCESCKAFFRRNALKNKDFRCPFQDSCKVDQVTRRFCQKCRLRKCFEIGMKKEWIMTEEEKQRKKQKIEENRARKMGDAVSDEEKFVDTVGIGGAKHPAPAYSPFPGTPAESKPQAVVVGVIRGEEEALAKVLRVEGQTDVHSQDRMIIHSTGNTSERVPLPSTLVSASRDYSSDFSNSSEHNVIPQCSGDQEYGSSMAHSAIVPQFLPYSHDVTSPGKPPSVGSILDHRNLIPYSDQKGFTLTNDDTSSTQADQDAREGSPSMGGPASPTSSNPGNTMSMAEVMAMNIKKEVEYPEEKVSLCTNDEQIGQEVQTHTDDTWKNFSVQDTLRLLEPGCKQSSGATGLTMMDSIMNTAISAEYSAFSLLGSNNPRELNEPEKMKLSELSEANKGLLAPLCEDYNFKDLSNPSLINIINLTEIAIRRLIKMSKRISAFKSLCQEDQIALLKGGCTEMMILRSVCAYDPDKDSWMIQQDHDRFKNIKLKVLKAAPGNVYEEHKRFILAFQPEWRQDHNIIFLLSAITLFTPERPNIIHGDAIKHEQCSYLYLLKRYLECKYGGCEGRTVYLRLLERIKHLHILNENHIRVFLEVNPQEVEPLLIEIFDLKHR